MSWQTRYIPANNEKGEPVISVLAKRTYSFENGKIAVVCDEQPEFISEDIFVNPDNPIYSDVENESELIPYKLSTDFVVNGKAHAPSGSEVYHLDCGVEVGNLNKTIRVFGDRKAVKRLSGISISDPDPFSEMELGYAKAFGGFAKDKKGTLFSYYPNPIGKGFTLKGGFENIDEILIPNIEYINSPITAKNIILSKFSNWTKCPKPASLGWTRRNFFPRYTYAGILSDQLERATENLFELNNSSNIKIPKMDYRMYQGASDGLWGECLQGNETVKLKYLDSEFSTFIFRLPSDIPNISIDIGDGFKELDKVLHSVVVDKENNSVTTIWRGALKYGGIEEFATLGKIFVNVKSI